MIPQAEIGSALLKAGATGVRHAITRTLSVLVVIGIGWAVWVTVIKPHTKWATQTKTTKNEAENMAVTTIDQPKYGSTFGCSHTNLYIRSDDAKPNIEAVNGGS